MEKIFFSSCIQQELTLSTGEYDFNPMYDSDAEFYVAITDSDDMCVQYTCLTEEIATEVFLELEKLDDPLESIREVCELRGLDYNG